MAVTHDSRRAQRARRQARLAFERGRVLSALRFSWPMAVWAVASVALDPVATVAIPGVVLLLGTIGFAWRGGSWRRGAALGTIVGFVTWMLSANLRVWRFDLDCAGCDGMRECALTCVSLGLLGGVGLGLLAVRDREPVATCVAAIASTMFGGLMARGATGLYSGSGIVFAYVIGAVPCVFANARTRS